MSVLIKNMEMPRHCSGCPMYDGFGCCMYSLGIPSRYNYNPDNIPDWCEVIEVPTPHGRLIDKDELEVDTEWSDYYDGYQSYSAMQIKYAPTVIESEE